MKYRLTVIFLFSLLFASFSFNCLHYDALIRTEYSLKFDNKINSAIIAQLHNQIIRGQE